MTPEAENPSRRRKLIHPAFLMWLVPILSSLILFLLPRWSLRQDTAEKEIRVLIDRPPNTLDPRHSPDVMARRILPLLSDHGYRRADGSALEDFRLLPEDPGAPALRFLVVKEDLTRGVLFSRGRADVLYDSLSLSKTAHFRLQGKNLLEAPGHHLSFLGFHLKNPLLALPQVRRAIRGALPVALWAQQKYFNFVDLVPDGAQALRTEDLNRILDESGLIRGKDGFRFTLRYLTTPVREGNELALLVREALREIGIRVQVIPLETSLFFSRLRKGDFELFGSRMLRSQDKSPVGDWFRTGAPRNYFSYSNPGLDAYLSTHPRAAWEEIRGWIEEDLPCVPLFFWRHGLLLSDRLSWKEGRRPLVFDDSFRFLSLLQIK